MESDEPGYLRRAPLWEDPASPMSPRRIHDHDHATPATIWPLGFQRRRPAAKRFQTKREFACSFKRLFMNPLPESRGLVAQRRRPFIPSRCNVYLFAVGSRASWRERAVPAQLVVLSLA